MKFRYQKQVDYLHPQLPWKSRPFVRVRLSFNDQHQAVFALIDSGADVSLFHISMAKTLGITTFEQDGWVAGISGEKTPIYYQTLALQLAGSDEPISIRAGFVDLPGVSALLGQSDFFQHFKICFERSKDAIEIRPAN
jgi:aspartyl protease